MITSPQVILSFDLESSLKQFISSRYSGTAKGRSYSDFMENHAKELTFCFTHNSSNANLLSFQNGWGDGSTSQHQTTFAIEILDPQGDFETAFLGLYAKDGNWENALKNYFDESIERFGESVKESEKLQGSLGSWITGLRGHPGKRGFDKVSTEFESLADQVENFSARQDEPFIDEFDKYLKLFVGDVDAPLPLQIGQYVRDTLGRGKGSSALARLAWEEQDKKDRNTPFPDLAAVMRMDFRDLFNEATNKFEELTDAAIYNLMVEVVQNLDAASFKDRNKIDPLFAELAAIPFSKNMWISFGIGDDTGSYAPPQIVRIKDIEYSITNENIRKFKLLLVPIAGLTIFDEGESVLHNYQDSDRIIVYDTEPLLVPGRNELVDVMTAMERLIKRVISSVIGNDVMSAYGNLQLSLNRKLSEFVISKGSQILGRPDVLAKAGLPPLGKTEGGEQIKIDETTSFFQRLSTDTLNYYKGMPAVEQRRKAIGGRNITSLQQLSLQISIYSAFFGELGLPVEANFGFAGTKINTAIFDTLEPELLNFATTNQLIKKVFGETSYKISFSAENKSQAKAKILGLLKKLDMGNEDFHILAFPEAGTGITIDKPRAMIISTPVWNALINKTMPALINKIPKGSGRHQRIDHLRDIDNSWQAFHKAENDVSATHPFGDPYNPLKIDQLLLNNQGIIPEHTQGGPFGPQITIPEQQVVGSLETFLPGQKDSTFDSFRQKVREDKIPIFIYGPANSNIIDFQFDLKPWMAYLANVVPKSINSYLLTKSVKSGQDTGDVKGLKQAIDLWETLGKGDPKARAALEQIIKEQYFASTASLGHGSDARVSLSRAMELGEEWPATIPWNRLASTGALTTTELTLAGIDPVGLQAGNVSFGQYRAGILNFLARYFQAYEAFPANRVISATHADSFWLQNMLNIQNSISQMSFHGTITTLPIFDLMSPMKLGKQAIIYFVEPQLVGPEKLSNTKPYQTWLTGAYWITGYEAVINETGIYTKFSVRKVPAS